MSLDLILTISQRSFQKFLCNKNWFSNFERITVTVMKFSFQKLKAKAINYRTYKRFCNESYQNELVAEFSKQTCEENSLEKFLEVGNKKLDNHAQRYGMEKDGNCVKFRIKNLKTLLCGNLLSNRKPSLLFILSQ